MSLRTHELAQGLSFALAPDDDRMADLRPTGLGASDDKKTITVRLANSFGERNAARMLINRRYSWRGYGNDHSLPTLPSKTTFTATSETTMIGTITLAVDAEEGLAADQIFKAEIDRFRDAPGAKVCELTKLAFDAGAPSKPLLASLFHIVFIYGYRRYDCTDLFIEVNPRHRRFYEAMLGFTPVGEVKMNQGVGAPAQLMWLDIATIRRRIDALGGQNGEPPTRSLYSFFFSRREEDAIYGRLIDEPSRSTLADGISGVRFSVPQSTTGGSARSVF
jgi:hypothetical protein